MDTSKAQEEIDRIERELDAMNPPPGKPPARQRRSGGQLATTLVATISIILFSIFSLFRFSVALFSHMRRAWI